MPEAMPPEPATASASSTTPSRVTTRSPSASTATLHLTRSTLTVRGDAPPLAELRQHRREVLEAVQVVSGVEQVDVRGGDHHADGARDEVGPIALVRVHPDD